MPGHGDKVNCCPDTAILPHTTAGNDTRFWEGSQGSAVSCRLPAQLNASRILQSQNKAPSPFPSILQLLTAWTFFSPPHQHCLDLGIFIPCPSLLSPRALCLTSLQIGEPSASETPMLPPTQEPLTAHKGARSSTYCQLIFT